MPTEATPLKKKILSNRSSLYMYILLLHVNNEYCIVNNQVHYNLFLKIYFDLIVACEKYRNCSLCVFHMLVLHDVDNVLITSCPHIADMMFCLQGTGDFIGWSCFSVVGPCPVMPLRFSLYPSCCPLHKKTLTCPRWTRAGSMPLFSLVSK